MMNIGDLVIASDGTPSETWWVITTLGVERYGLNSRLVYGDLPSNFTTPYTYWAEDIVRQQGARIVRDGEWTNEMHVKIAKYQLLKSFNGE